VRPKFGVWDTYSGPLENRLRATCIGDRQRPQTRALQRSGAQVPVQEIPDEGFHFIELVLEREMPCVEQVELRVRQVAKIRPGAIGREDLVVRAPHNQRRRLSLAKESLELRIERHVSPVIAEQVELDILVPRTIEQYLVVHPVVGVNPRQVRHPVGVLEPGGLQRNELGQCVPVGLRAVCPIRLDRIPERLQPLVIRVAVLNHERAHLLRVL
jgi:hypothetical protein